MYTRKGTLFDVETMKDQDATVVVQKLNEGMPHIKFLLRSQEDQHNTDEFILNLTCTLAKACRASQGENTNKILAALKGSVFVSSKIPHLLDRVQASTALSDQESRRSLIHCLIIVFMKYLTHLPSSYADLPYVQLQLALDQSSIDRKEELQKELDAFKTARDDIIRGERQKRGKRYTNRAGEKPPNDFREIPICPTNKEITTQERPFLRKNISKGRYENGEHYLDVQFRLLREDFLEPLREGIHELVQNVPRQQRKQLMKYYQGVRIVNKKFTWSGITHQVQIDVSRVDTNRWAQSKRLLFGSFLCLSKDNFETMLFATVSERDPKELTRGRIDIRFIEEQDVLDIEKRQQQYQMVESPAYFEAYRHVLKGLQELNEDSLPFKKYLVECSADVDPPDYLRRGGDESPVCYDLSEIVAAPYARNATQVPVLQLQAWPSADALLLNSSQLAALQTAVTTEFSVIQGPPGTGKTHVGAKIVQCLLANRDQWDLDKNSPMLMVCYTNHALDQFLEKVLDFLPASNIIRVGGGCKSKPLEQCSIKLFTKRYRISGERERIKEKIVENDLEIEFWKDSLAKANTRVLAFEQLEDRMDSRHTDQLYNAVFPSNARTKCQTIGNTFQLWLCNNKKLNEMNQHTSRESESVECIEGSIMSVKDGNEVNSHVLCDADVTELDANENACNLVADFDGLSTDDRLKPPVFDKRANGISTVGKEEMTTFESGHNPAITSFRDTTQLNGKESLRNGWNQMNLEVVTPDSLTAENNTVEGVQLPFHGKTNLSTAHNRNTGGNQFVTTVQQENQDQFADFITNEETVYECLEATNEDNKGKVSRARDANQETIPVDEEAAVKSTEEGVQLPFQNGTHLSTSHTRSEEDNQFTSAMQQGKQDQFADLISNVEVAFECVEAANEDSKEEVTTASDANQETIAVDEEATVIQNQRCIEGDEEYMSEIPKQFVERKHSQKSQVDVPDDNQELREANYGKKCTSYFWLNKANETIRGESKGHPLLQTENKREGVAVSERATSSQKGKTKNRKINLTADMKHVKTQLQNETMMADEEAIMVPNIWFLSAKDRVRLYLYWLQSYRERCREYIRTCEQRYEELCSDLAEVRAEEEENVIRRATVVGMTTSGAARYHSMLQRIAPKIVIIEEAAEVMEAHIITSLSRGTKHTILIGDHKQLRPKTTVFKLAQEYNLGISLFERMVMNSMDCKCLSIQHRMRPEIATLTKRIYNHEIIDHESVCNFDDISGMGDNLFFIDHREPEKEERGLQSFSNPHEAGFLVALCRYLLLQGYKPEQITVLTMYTGQLLELKNRMPKNMFHGVRVCVVDNFQGEENDIILLSLVRSNLKIGFLQESNRICVALSRARQGFYCIGNFNLLTSKCNLWKEICDDLESRNAIGQTLKLVCKRHKSINDVRSPNEFQNFPLGGCDKICGERLDCGHACDRPCHPTDVYHERGQCSKVCRRSCPNDHQCQKRCHHPLDCFCGQPVVKLFPICGHQQTIQCCIDVCQVKCERTLDCGHECKEVCGNPCTRVCRVNCNKTLPCGHEKVMQCYQHPTGNRQCNNNCSKVLDCGHPCSKRCKDRCQCNTTIEVELTCKHRVQVLCPKRFKPPLCFEKCCRDLDCGHRCPRLCHEKCSAYKCEMLVDKVLPCGHAKRMPCHVDTHSAVCQELCQKTCYKGHPCQQPCHFGLPCRDCKVVVNTTIPACQHTTDTLCYVDPAKLVCKKPCERDRVCGHPCRGICGKKCESLPCMKLVTKTLPCEHIVTVACHRNPETYKCKTNVVIDLSCGHKTSMECYAMNGGLQNFLCKEKVERELPCKHKVILPCHRSLNTYKCKTKVDVQMTCGHTISVICSTMTAALQSLSCMVKMKRTLPCKHEAILPCCKNAEEYSCQEEVEVGLSCGHMKRFKCSRAAEGFQNQACQALVMKTLPCGHEKEVRCLEKPEEVFCDVPCEKPLLCKHPCRGRCSDDCRRVKCTEEVHKALSCGHTFSCRCSDDVSQVVCTNKCKRKMLCGHLCTGKCSDKCSQRKCKIMVTKKLHCPGKHTRRVACCEDTTTIVCQKICKRKLDCGHPCPGLCGEPCGLQKCMQRVKETFSCGHKESLSCFQRKIAICTARCRRRKDSCNHVCKGLCGEPCSKYPCNVPVTKTLPCGHKIEMPCSDDPAYVQCLAECAAKLQCGHQCSGTCGDCQQRGSHEMCRRPCSRLLVCLHRCKAICCEPCPPCDRECSRRCPHEKCSKRCSQPCEPCKQPCKWSCPHYQCNNLCGECVGHRCPRDARCPEKLVCGHPCFGLCGESCPKVCGVCHAKKFSSIAANHVIKAEATRFLQLFDCGHIVKVEEMDSWMARELGSDVQLIRCPRCTTPITFSYRYGYDIKRTLKNIENVKAQIQDSNENVGRSVCRLTTDLKHLNYSVERCLKFPQAVLPVRPFPTKFFKLNLRNIHWRDVLFLFTVDNHLKIIQLAQTAVHVLQRVQGIQASSKQRFEKDKLANSTKDSLENIEEYLKKPELDLKTLCKVYEHTRKLFLFSHVLEVQSEAVNRQILLSRTGTTQLKSARDRFDLFLQGYDDALDHEWLEEVVNSLRAMVKLPPLPTEEAKDFANFPGYQRGVWKLCEQDHVYHTGWFVRGGEDVPVGSQGCYRCATD